MAAKNRPYEQFGAFILFKKLEADALGDLWRAGRIEGSQLGEVVALRRLTGGNREAFVSSAGGARQVVPQLTGTSSAKHQEIDIGGGFSASCRDAAFTSSFGRYFPPESRTTGEPTKASEVFALGAIFYLLITGSEPPDAMTASAFMLAIRGAKTMTGPVIPDDIRVILDKSLNLDVNARYASVADMKQALSALAHGGKYSATTFNLAFYLNNLLKKEMEGEALERDKEGKVNVAAYLEQPATAAPPAREETTAPPMFGVTD